jgi:hypothetical protein
MVEAIAIIGLGATVSKLLKIYVLLRENILPKCRVGFYCLYKITRRGVFLKNIPLLVRAFRMPKEFQLRLIC